MSSEEPGSINEYLTSLGGVIHSSGEFSVDVNKALHKLETYSLPVPELFVVELLALAVSRKAKTFSASSDSGWCTVTFDGVPLEAEDIRTPKAGLLRKDATPSQLHFSLAFTGATTLSPAGIRYRGPRVCGSFVEGKWQLEKEQENLEHQVFEVESPFSFLEQKFRRRETLHQLLAPCNLAPILMTVQGKLLKGGLRSKVLWGDKHSGTLTIAGGEWTTRRKLFDSGLFHAAESHLDYLAELHLGSATAAQKEGLFLVHNGVSYEGEVLDLGPSVCGQIYCNHFQRNLSGTGIVRSAYYTEVIEDIQQKTKEYLGLLIRSPLRLRANSLHLQGLVEENLKTDPAVAEWLADIESMESFEMSLLDHYDEMWQLAEGREPEKVREIATVLLEKSLKSMEGWTYRREKTFEHGASWNWLDLVEPDNYRWRQARDFHEVCLQIRGQESKYTGPLSPLTESLLHRVRGRTQEAIDCLQTFSRERGLKMAKRHLAECHLALGNDEMARGLGLENLGWSSVPSKIHPTYEQKSADFDLLADVLEVSGLGEKSLFIRKAILDHEYDDYSHYLRKDHLADSQRSRLGFGGWVQLRAQAARDWVRLVTSLRLYSIPRPLRRALTGKVDRCTYSSLRKFFDDTGAIYELAFDFLASRVAQNLRRQGNLREADRFLATAHLLVRATRLATALVEGVEGREDMGRFG